MSIKKIILLLLLSFFVSVTFLFGQGAPPPPPPPPACSTCVPLDGGIFWLLLAATSLGLYSIYKQQKSNVS